MKKMFLLQEAARRPWLKPLKKSRSAWERSMLRMPHLIKLSQLRWLVFSRPSTAKLSTILKSLSLRCKKANLSSKRLLLTPQPARKSDALRDTWPDGIP